MNRSEELRAAVIRGGGSWNVERGERGVVFRVRVPRTTTAAHRGPASKERSFDLDRFLAAYGDDPDISREILRLYRDEAPARLATIADAITHEELAPVIKAAHSLANTSGTLQSDEAVEAARELEQAARTNDLDRVRATFERLKPIVAAMVREIDLALDDAG